MVITINNKPPMFICTFKERVPNPGTCAVIKIDFENRKLVCSNGVVRLTAQFDDVILKTYLLKKNGEDIYITLTNL
jgi:hypothetical protein